MKLHALAVAVTALVIPTVAFAQGAKPASPVVVTNDSSAPVPVTVNGTPNVSVANTPSVTVTNTPTIAGITNPVKTVTAPLQPVSGRCIVPINLNSFSAACSLFGPVPAGKLLIVEFFSYNTAVSLTTTPRYIILGAEITATASSNPVAYVNAQEAYSNSQYRAYAAAVPLRLYVDESQYLSVDLQLNGPAENYLQGFHFSGQLVDK